MDSSRSMTSGEKRKVQGVRLTLDKGVDSSRLVRSAVKMRIWGTVDSWVTEWTFVQDQVDEVSCKDEGEVFG